jgi:hypothetical protein
MVVVLLHPEGLLAQPGWETRWVMCVFRQDGPDEGLLGLKLHPLFIATLSYICLQVSPTVHAFVFNGSAEPFVLPPGWGFDAGAVLGRMPPIGRVMLRKRAEAILWALQWPAYPTPDSQYIWPVPWVIGPMQALAAFEDVVYVSLQLI